VVRRGVSQAADIIGPRRFRIPSVASRAIFIGIRIDPITEFSISAPPTMLRRMASPFIEYPMAQRHSRSRQIVPAPKTAPTLQKLSIAVLICLLFRIREEAL
jgi:hypothetical protein